MIMPGDANQQPSVYQRRATSCHRGAPRPRTSDGLHVAQRRLGREPWCDPDPDGRHVLDTAKVRWHGAGQAQHQHFGAVVEDCRQKSTHTTPRSHTAKHTLSSVAETSLRIR